MHWLKALNAGGAGPAGQPDVPDGQSIARTAPAAGGGVYSG
jgi:hypothetical protein